MIECACGCGEERPRYSPNGVERRFIYGHQNRKPTEAQRVHREWLASRRRVLPPWNKGKNYIISKRLSYANKGSWSKALKRLHGDVCMRCGWQEAPCDTHHITAKRNGGKYELVNGVVLCPNCHRLAEVGAATTDELLALKGAAPIIGQAV